jgi:uncharacterized membrane protein
MKRILCFILIAMTHILIFYVPAKSKSYRIERVAILAQVNPDGSMDIQESRTYRFRGQFKWADYRLPIKGFLSVENFTLRDEDMAYRPSDSEERGTYQVRQTRDEFYVKWFYRASNENRTFVLSYRVTDVLKVYPDVAEVYYQFIGTGWDHGAGEVTVTVKLPEGARSDDVRAWAHGPLWGNVSIEDAATVRLDISNLPKRRYWEGRVLFPARLVPGLALAGTVPQLNNIIAEETQWAKEANEARIRAQQQLAARNERWLTWSIIFAVVSIAGILFWIPVYRQHGKAYRPTFRGKFYSDIPTDLPPALIGHLVNHRTVSGGALVATLFDLARRGILTIEEEKIEKKTLFGKKEKKEFILVKNSDVGTEEFDSIQLFEQEALDYLFEELSDGTDRISMKEIAKSRSKTVKWFNKWRKQISELAKEQGFYDLDSRRKMLKGLVPSIALIVVGPIAIFLAGPGAITPFATGFTLLIITLATYRVARPYVDQYAQWKALRRYLQKYKFVPADRSKLTDNLSRCLVYGMVLGLTSKRIKELVGLVPGDQCAVIFPWYLYHGTFAPENFGTAFGEAVSSMVTVAGSTFSSATGAGGGASAGGGGGAGGSGGGAG